MGMKIVAVEVLKRMRSVILHTPGKSEDCEVICVESNAVQLVPITEGYRGQIMVIDLVNVGVIPDPITGLCRTDSDWLECS